MTHDLELGEAKQFVGLHARLMGLRDRQVDTVLDGITTLHGHGPDTWTTRWSRAADRQARAGHQQTAAHLYNLARFPYAKTPAQRTAAELAARSLHSWLLRTGKGERRRAVVDGHTVPFLFRAGPRPGAPLVVMMGGIVSLKEQWGGMLSAVPRLGCAVAIADFPGTGENPVPYTRAAARLYGALLDEVAGACDVHNTLVIAPSFSGHLALVHAAADDRIRRVITVGAPLTHFFTDPPTRAAMPRITRAALCHTTGAAPDALDTHLAALALRPAEISGLRIPVRYIASLRDEIIPQRDWREAAGLHPRFLLHTFDDVHGSPNHLKQTRVLVIADLLHHAGRGRLSRLVSRIGRTALRTETARTARSHPSR